MFTKSTVRAAMSTLVAVAVCPSLVSVSHANSLPAISTTVVTDKSRYIPGHPVSLLVTIQNHGQSAVSGSLHVAIDHLSKQVATLPATAVTVEPGKSQRVTLTWTAPKVNYQGYLVDETVNASDGKSLSEGITAIDVSSEWAKFPRYGYVSQYPEMTKAQVQSELESLNQYHIDALQFYDWQAKHDVPLAGTVKKPASSWQDIAGRTNYRQTILDLINTGHQLGMSAFNYNLLYGAWADYQKDGVKPSWGLFSDSGAQSQLSFAMPSGWSTSAIDVFNPENPGWRSYLLSQEAKVFAAYPFDGWQVDQLGNQGTVYDAKGNVVDLESTFTPFLNAAVSALHKQVIFNDVGGYGLSDVAANAREAVAYVECWLQSGQAVYSDLKNVIDQVNTLSHGRKATVLAGYMDSNYANNFSSDKPGYFNAPGVLLTDATIFASGGSHIELGDDLQMLNAPYFPNHNLVMSGSLKARLLSYYNFLVAYENLLRGGVTNTPNAVSVDGVKLSKDGQAHTVWAFSKSGQGYHVLHLINLTNATSPLWMDSDATQPAPKSLQGLHVKYYVGHQHIQSVNVASPDLNSGISQSVAFTAGHDAKGNYVTFTVPSLQYWDMIYMKIAR